MKARIEKKLSKKLAAIMGKHCREVWIDNEYEPRTPHWKIQNPNGLTKKQLRENRQARAVRVNHMPSCGGELDYWGEGTDWRSVYSEVKEQLWWLQEDFSIGHDQFEEMPTEKRPHPWKDVRMTGLFILREARKFADAKGQTP